MGNLATNLYFSVVFAVLEHSVLEREYAPLFQAYFVLEKVVGGAYSYSGYKFHVHLITSCILSIITKRSIVCIL